MGRKANFDRKEKLMVAMQLFWQKGYANTAVSDLVDKMQINRFSLYHTYGDKQQLYYEAINAYLTEISMPRLDALRAQNAGWDELYQFLNEFTELQKKNSHGCFMQNALVEHAGCDDRVLESGHTLFDDLIQLLTQVITQAQQHGHLNPNLPAASLAALVLSQMQGIRVLSKAKRYEEIDASFYAMTVLLKGDKK